MVFIRVIKSAILVLLKVVYEISEIVYFTVEKRRRIRNFILFTIFLTKEKEEFVLKVHTVCDKVFLLFWQLICKSRTVVDFATDHLSKIFEIGFHVFDFVKVGENRFVDKFLTKILIEEYSLIVARITTLPKLA